MNSALTLDTTIPITEGAREIVKTLLEAIALVILVVFIFLQSWRATLIPILTVPVSLVGAFLFSPRSDSPPTVSRFWGWCWRWAWWSMTRSWWSKRSK